jgi:hypothetical protein
MTEAETRAAEWLEAWDAQGIHRTGTAGDLAGAAWLAAEAAAVGAKVEIEEFALDRLDRRRLSGNRWRTPPGRATVRCAAHCT